MARNAYIEVGETACGSPFHAEELGLTVRRRPVGYNLLGGAA